MLRAQAFDTGPAGDSYPEATLATLVSQGELAGRDFAARVRADGRGLRARCRVARTAHDHVRRIGRRQHVLHRLRRRPKQFDPNRIDSTIAVGTVEEWTVLNATQELHVFHIHQTDFQVTEINGVPQPFVGHQDNVNVPSQADATPRRRGRSRS